MALSALDDPSVEPTSEQLPVVLQDAMEAWTSLVGWLAESPGVQDWEWFCSGKKYGWALRGKRGKRTIVYLIPQHGSFLVGLVLGDRALVEVRRATLSAAALEVILGARRYAEGTGFRLPVVTSADLDDIRTLVGIKLAH